MQRYYCTIPRAVRIRSVITTVKEFSKILVCLTCHINDHGHGDIGNLVKGKLKNIELQKRWLSGIITDFINAFFSTSNIIFTRF